MTDYRWLGFLIYEILEKCQQLQNAIPQKIERKDIRDERIPITDENIGEALGFCLEIYNLKVEGEFRTVKSRESKP